jgi:fibronectin-binding autotransporter adhesin
MVTSRATRISLAVLPLLLASTAVHAATAEETGDRTFMSGFEMFYAGPQWFLDALPGTKRARSRYVLDRAGDVVESTGRYNNAYVGTLADVFNVNFFNNISFFVGTSQSKISSPTLAAATPPDYYWAVNGAAAGFGGSGTWDAGTTPNWNDSTGIGTPTVWVDGNNAIFGGTPGTVTLNSAVTARSLLFSASGYGILGSGTLTLTNTGTGGPGPATIEVQNAIASIGNTIAGTAGMTKTGSGTLILSGTNTYTGFTTIAAGELILSPSGSLSSSSTIRLGDTSVNSPSAQFRFGATGGGETISNPLIVQASASGTEGRRTLLADGTNGSTNTWTGNITLNTDLVVQSAAVGGSAANGQGILLFTGGVIDVLDNSFKMDSSLNGNGTDTYSIQGIVQVDGVLGSSLPTGGSVIKDGSGTLILTGVNNNYTGTNASTLNPNGTIIRGGVLGIFGDGSLGLAPTNGTNNVFFQSSAFNTNGDSIAPTLRAETDGIVLASTRNINIASGVTGTFDSDGNTFTIAGVINGGGGNLNKVGAGTLILTGANTYTGTTTISQGVLNAAVTGALGGTNSITVNNGGTLLVTGTGNLNRINNSAPIVLGGGTGADPIFERSGSGTVSEGIGAQRTGPLPVDVMGTSTAGLGALSLQSNATFNFGTLGAGMFVFGAFTSNMNTLTILNWSNSNADITAQTSGIDGADDRLIFSGIPNAVELAQFVNFDGTPATFIMLDAGFYEVVPVPEPGTWIGAALALAAIGFTQRRRLRKKL